MHHGTPPPRRDAPSPRHDPTRSGQRARHGGSGDTMIPRGIRALLAAVALFAPWAVPAATITATVADDQGRPLADAVVTISPEPGTGTPSPDGEASTPISVTIDQKSEIFVPAVVALRAGGSAMFRDSDNIRHHVYSFSPVRRFEMVQTPGETSAPIVFPQPGVVAIGCNIHDHMSAYIFVTAAPWSKVTGANGQAVLTGLPAGRFVATVWHPRLRPRAEPPVQNLSLATENSSISVTLPVLPPRRPRARDY